MVGIFQFENPGTRPIVEAVGMESLADVSAITSLLRPGPKDMGMHEEYARRKHGGTYDAPQVMRDMLADTYGVMVYQEQCMQMSRVLAGFTPSESNKLRKAIGKKIPELMEKMKAKFIEGAKEVGIVDESEAERIWSLMEAFAGYGFNRAHAVTYSAITTVELYLKHHYPLEYITALANNTKQGKKKHGSTNILVDYLNYARRRDFEVLAPSVSRSGVNFRIEAATGRDDTPCPAIRFSLSHIKNVAKAAEAIEEAQPFASVEDFNERVKSYVNRKQKDGSVKRTGQKLNKRVFESLMYAGAFDIFGTRNEVAAEFARLRKQKSDPIELTDEQWLEKEREVLGMVLSREPLVRRAAKFIKANKVCTIAEEAQQKKIRLFGRITAITPHTSQKGNAMYRTYIDDGIDSMMFYVFQGGQQAFKDAFKVGDVGIVPMDRFDDGGMRFFDDRRECVVLKEEEICDDA
jgi:DNA polymerase-3 subunit alpha